MANKPKMSFWQIWNMNFGFLGVQCAFGLQQANMSPIYRYLGAEESTLPLLWLAGPVTGLVIQPFIGAMSDRTWHKKWGRRRPYFIIGAIITSIALVLMPYSTELWMAAGLLWMLDGAANVIMEPFRALIADKLPEEQRPLGFSLQSFFLGLGQTLANIMPLLMAALGVSTVLSTSQSGSIPDFVRYSFFIGSIAVLVAVAITVFNTTEAPPETVALTPKKKGLDAFFSEIIHAIIDMPPAMKQLWWMKFFTWYGLPLMWQYLAIALSTHCFGAPSPTDPNFGNGIKWANIGLTLFNITCFIFSLFLPRCVKLVKPHLVHALSLAIGATGFVAMNFTNNPYYYMVAMGLVGIAWASIMSTPYIMLSSFVPPARMGVYMGLFNTFIVVPQIINMLSIPVLYPLILKSEPRNALLLAGISFTIAAVLAFRLKIQKSEPGEIQPVNSPKENAVY